MTALRTGVDLGGSKIEAIVLDGAGVELARDRVATPETYDAVLDTVSALISKVEASAGGRSAGLGIGTPGSGMYSSPAPRST